MDSSDNLFLKYMVESFDREFDEPKPNGGGTFITISREYGCQANALAILLRDEFSKKGKSWSILNKEIIMESARQLGMDPRKVMNIAESTERSQIDEVIHALTTKYYKSDRKIRQTVSSVLISAASAGNAIIVGRAGAAITRGMQPSIHIKLYAPLEWRVNSLMTRYHATREHVMKEIASIDSKRSRMMLQAKKSNENYNELYDLHINVSTIPHEQTLALIMAIAKERFKTAAK